MIAKAIFPDYEEDSDETCSKCGHSPIHWRRCDTIGCDDGYINLYDDDPLWYDEDDVEACGECNGTGFQRWCPKCGADLSGVYQPDEEE